VDHSGIAAGLSGEQGKKSRAASGSRPIADGESVAAPRLIRLVYPIAECLQQVINKLCKRLRRMTKLGKVRRPVVTILPMETPNVQSEML
jgi:hypothetical protein